MERALAAVLLLVFTVVASAQKELASTGKDMSHEGYRVLVAMAECKTLSCLTEQRARRPKDDTIADIVFFSRQTVIHPSKDSAAGLLQSTPVDEDTQMTFTNFTSWQDGMTESTHDMDVLGKVYFDWPKLVAKAALMRPEMMSNYVQFLRLAANDIHSDFTGNAEHVCRTQRAAFNKAFRALPEKDQEFIRRVVFQPDTCTAVFRSEAD